MSSLDPLDKLEPHAKAYMLRRIREGAKPLQQMSLEDARQFMRDNQTARLEDPGIELEIRDLDGLQLTIVRPARSPERLPAVLYLHGGGWVLGGIDTHARIVREMALRSNVAVVVPGYSLAPEAKFPVALNQCYTAALCLQSSAKTDNIDGSRLAVAGDSAGGNLAAAMALRAAQRGDLKLRLQALICPAMQATSATPSYAEFAEGLNLTREDMEWFWSRYVTDEEQRQNPEVSPVHADQALLSHVAPALILTAECDVLRDEAEQYAHCLAAADAEITAVRFLGTLHNFPVIDELRQSGPAQTALRLISDALRQALHETNGPERLEL